MQRDIGKEFMAASNYPPETQTDEQKGLPKPGNPDDPAGHDKITFKLPSPEDTVYSSHSLSCGSESSDGSKGSDSSCGSQSPEVSGGSKEHLTLFEILRTRRSVRRYSAEEISAECLSYLLWASCGVSGDSDEFRTAPSAGAIHPVETYISVQNCSWLPVKNGIWYYHPTTHELSLISEGTDAVAGLGRACMMQPQVLRAPVVFFWTAKPYRAVWKYGTRGYRDIFLDAGHICQNLYLAGVDAGIGVCAINAFADEAVKAILHLPEDETVVYAATCGHKRQ